MSDPVALSPDAVPTSRRRFLLELAGVAVVVAIPVGAAFATARPIANPPSREALDVFSEERKALIEQRSSDGEDSTDNSDWKKAREERKKARDARKKPEQGEGDES